MNKLDAFITSRKQHRTQGRNRLLPYKQEIEYLLNNGMGYKDISDYLQTEGVKVAISTIGAFCRKHFNPQKQIRESKPSHAVGEVKEDIQSISTETKSEALKTDEEEIPQHQQLAKWAQSEGGKFKSVKDFY